MGDGRITRRGFLGGLAAAGGLVAAGGTLAGCSRGSSTPQLSGYPFTLGVASGDPTADAVVLWTRLAPEALEPGGGMPAEDVEVRWEVAGDDRFGDVVAQGTAVASPDRAHAVHVDVGGLAPGREYHYRFLLGDDASPVGRAVTTAAAGELPAAYVIGQMSCARWGEGYYAGYRDMAGAGCDLVVCCGDYVYERGPEGGDAVRPGQITAITLDDYRYLYALHRSDEDLRAAHEACPWAVIWDDHEMSNDYMGDTPHEDSESATTAEHLERRAAAYRAWWEHMPVRLDPPDGPDLPIHRALDVGALARLHLVDTRQFRTPLACPDTVGSIGRRCDASFEPETTFLGHDQEGWLAASLRDGERVWDVVANQVVLHQWRFGPGDNTIWNLDQWDGYPVARGRLLDDLAASAGEVVVLTGDVHSTWIADLHEDFDRPASAHLGTELVAPGITSEGELLDVVVPAITANNPHVRYAEALHRGWLRHEVTAERWTTEIRHIDDPEEIDSPVTTAATWSIEPGRPAEEA